MSATALALLLVGCTTEQSPSTPDANGDAERSASEAAGSLEACEDAPESKAKLDELSITDFVLVTKQRGSGSCPELTACWSGMFAEEVPAQTTLHFRTTDHTVPCAQELRVDITPIRDAYLEGQRGNEFALVIDGWGGVRVPVR